MIEVFCIDNCPNCDRLCGMLKQKNIAFEHYNIDGSNADYAEGAFRGILNSQFPVVFINGAKLPADTPENYIKSIEANI